MSMWRILPALALTALAAVALTGCASPFAKDEDSFNRDVTAALIDAGYEDAWGGIGLDGFSRYASVGVIYPDQPMSREDLLEIAGIAFANGAADYHYLYVSGRTVGFDYEDDGEPVDTCAAGIELGWTKALHCDEPWDNFQITFDEWKAATGQ